MRKISLGLLAAFVAAAFTGCGGGGGGSGGASGTRKAPATGTFLLKDAASFDVKDQNGQVVFTMTELWLTITGASFEDTQGNSVLLTLAATPTPLKIDVLSLASTSTLLAVGTFPAGTYEKLTLTLSPSGCEMVGTAAGASAPSTVTLVLQSPDFDTKFKPPVLLDPATQTTFVIDWTPAVSAATGGASGTVYTLEDDVKAFVLGGAAPGSPASQPVHHFDGEIVTIAANAMTIQDHGVVTAVDFLATTVFVDDHGNPLPNGAASLAVGDDVNVDGTALPNGTIEATRVEADGQGGNNGGNNVGNNGGHNGGHNGGNNGGNNGQNHNHQGQDIEGDVANASTSGPLTFDVVQGASVAAHVTTDPSTQYEFDNGGAATAADVKNTVRVEVEGAVTAGTPPTVAATHVQIK